ncbi:hypothetical protein KR093_008501, partial [Drosophila rubida]
NLKKSWHPHTMKNQERVWKAEQAKQEEQRKLDDLRKEINEERDREELRRLGENSGVLASSNGGEAKLEWMYKNNAELINREEYLLGRKIDKSFEQLEAEERRQEQSSTLGLKQSINHVEHECVPFSIREYRNLQSNEQVDMQRKTMEDPLMLIKQREMESRRKLLENPVKLKEIHRILKTEREAATKQQKKSKKSKKSKKKKHKRSSSNDDSDSDDDLDKKLARQMKKLKGEGTNDDFKLDKLLDAKYRTLTKQLDMATKQKKHKKKSKRRSESSANSESEDEIDNRSIEERSKRRERERDDDRRRQEQSYNRRRSLSPRREQRQRTRSPRRDEQKRQQSRTPRRERESTRSPRRDEQKRQRSRSPRREQRHRSDHRSDQQPTQRRNSRERQRRSPTPEKRQRRTPSPAAAPARQAGKPKVKLTESEREARLREMMDNATWREADRSKVVQKHREEYAREEAQNQARDFDQQFINKEVKKAIDNQTSIGNRIRSNLNNIQRNSSAMDANFARK